MEDRDWRWLYAAYKKGGPLARGASWEEISDVRFQSELQFMEAGPDGVFGTADDTSADVMGPRLGLYERAITETMSDQELVSLAIELGSDYATGITVPFPEQRAGAIRSTLINEIREKEAQKFSPLEFIGLFGARPVSVGTRQFREQMEAGSALFRVKSEISELRTTTKKGAYLPPGPDELSEEHSRRWQSYIREENE